MLRDVYYEYLSPKRAKELMKKNGYKLVPTQITSYKITLRIRAPKVGNVKIHYEIIERVNYVKKYLFETGRQSLTHFLFSTSILEDRMIVRQKIFYGRLGIINKIINIIFPDFSPIRTTWKEFLKSNPNIKLVNELISKYGIR